MSSHDMITSPETGSSICRHCGLLASQIRFSRDKTCTKAPAAITKQFTVGDNDTGVSIELTAENSNRIGVAQRQAVWFHNYSLRQLSKAITG